MRTITKAMLALGFVCATSDSAFEPAKAQGVYYSGPGVNVQVGDPDWRYRHQRRYYRNYDGPYAYALLGACSSQTASLDNARNQLVQTRADYQD